MKKIIILLALFSIAVSAQGTFTDSRDGKKYKTVKIGKQVWMAQNLDYHGSDGYLGLCYGDNPQQKVRKPENCQKYGRLYDWDEAMKACPKGWHLPSKKEWQTLADFVGGADVAGKKLKAKSEWEEYDFSRESPDAPKCKWTETDNRGRIVEHNMCTTDEYGFSALPYGPGYSNNSGRWWSSTENHDLGNRPYDFFMVNNYTFASIGDIVNSYKSNMNSVRCIQD